MTLTYKLELERAMINKSRSQISRPKVILFNSYRANEHIHTHTHTQTADRL